MQNKINLLFPIEVSSRELDFRLFLACLAARPQRRIWIGQQRVIYALANNMKGGLYLGKNLFGLPPNITWHRYRNLKSRGFRLIHLDEEGAVYRGGPEQWKQELFRRFDPTQMDAEDYICTWGDFQRDVYRSVSPPCIQNIRTTGHPRFDLYKPEYREYYDTAAKAIRERYGDFVLFNSNLHRVNNHDGTKRVFSERLGYYVKDPARRSQFFDRWRHLMFTFASFVRLANRLSVEFPDLNIVVRPHPSENKAFYHTVFDDVPNVHPVREGSVGPWLLACRAMIHDGCTTGLEAHLADVPVINYKPVEDEKHDSFLPNLFGTRCHSDEEVIAEIRRVLASKEPYTCQQKEEVPEQAIQLIDNLRRDSFPQLLGVIDEALSGLSNETSEYRALSYVIKENIRQYSLKVKREVLRGKKANERLDKFWPFDAKDVATKLEIAAKVTGTKVRHTLHSSDLLSIDNYKV